MAISNHHRAEVHLRFSVFGHGGGILKSRSQNQCRSGARLRPTAGSRPTGIKADCGIKLVAQLLSSKH
ncbi:hypothetical protein U1Q18_017121 [Sarracenia purpurea var. burkii]